MHDFTRSVGNQKRRAGLSAKDDDSVSHLRSGPSSLCLRGAVLIERVLHSAGKPRSKYAPSRTSLMFANRLADSSLAAGALRSTKGV